jgi:hypothetical protein
VKHELLQLLKNHLQRLPVRQRSRPRGPWHWEPLRPRRARWVASNTTNNLAMARSVGARLDPALLGRLDLLLVAAAVPAHLPSPVGVVRVRGRRWGPAVVLVRGQLGELDNELELTPAAVGG